MSFPLENTINEICNIIGKKKQSMKFVIIGKIK